MKATSQTQPVLSQAEIIRTYIRAKDENRPHLIGKIFVANATLEMIVEVGTIAFPPISKGIDEIAKVLVRDFSRTFENVYTFCLSDPPQQEAEYSCRWLVGMSEKDSGAVRVGCGRYTWVFQPDGKVQRLKIIICTMVTLSADSLKPVLDWLCGLSYPWCRTDEVVSRAPSIDGLRPVVDYLGRIDPGQIE